MVSIFFNIWMFSTAVNYGNFKRLIKHNLAISSFIAAQFGTVGTEAVLNLWGLSEILVLIASEVIHLFLLWKLGNLGLKVWQLLVLSQG